MPHVEKRALHDMQVKEQPAQRLVGARRRRGHDRAPHLLVRPVHVAEEIPQIGWTHAGLLPRYRLALTDGGIHAATNCPLTIDR
jgi:hypothetical protein